MASIEYENLKPLKAKTNEAEYQAEISLEILARHESKEIARMGKNVALPGFRKGKAPEEMLRERIDPVELLEEAAESSLRTAVRAIVENEKLDVLGIPQISVEKLEPGKPIVFKVTFALVPAVTLPDYKKLGRDIMEKKEEVTATDDEVRGALEHIRTIAAQTAAQTEKASTDGTVGADALPHKEKETEKLPELTDELAQKIGNFKTVTELTEALKRDLVEEKRQRAHDAKRDHIVREIVKHAKIEIPELLVEQEFERYREARETELERMGMTLAQYLEQIKKSEKDLDKEERAQIHDRLATSMVFQEIQKQENIEANGKEVAANAAILARRYPHEDPAHLRRSAEAFLIQEKIFKLFEPETKKEEATEITKN